METVFHPATATRSNAIMDTADAKRPDARRVAEDRFAKVLKRDAEVKAYQQQQWDAEAAKIARLRTLRLAREADDAKPDTALGKAVAVRRKKAPGPAKLNSNGSTGDKA
jgi:hypothetical protein